MKRLWFFAGCLLAGLIGMLGGPGPVDAAKSYETCAEINDDALRLRCYDEAAGRSRPEQPDSPDLAATPPPEQRATIAASGGSALSRIWQLDDESRRRRFAIMPHRQNYILPYAYNFTQDKATYEKANPGTEIQNAESKFQLSLKMKLWEDIFGTKMDL
ncbi:MAG TPA: phospholipase A, partial [Syntrophales bacterium]|nr:phospholipase A [Syntrophales bacterium]